MPGSASKQLLDDHRAVHEVLAQLLTALKNRDLKTSYLKLDLLWARLAVHIRAEHLHLFPAVTSCVTEAQTTVDRLREDHDFFMRELARALGILRQLSHSLDTPNDEARFSSVLDVVLGVERRLADHNDLEENHLYHLATTILTETEQRDLSTRINAELEHRPPRFSMEAWANE